MSDQNLWSSRENGCFISKNRIMLFLSFLGSDSYQAAEQSSSKFKAKMDGSLWMAHLVCYKNFYKAIHVKVNKSLEAEGWLICFLCLRPWNRYRFTSAGVGCGATIWRIYRQKQECLLWGLGGERCNTADLHHQFIATAAQGPADGASHGPRCQSTKSHLLKDNDGSSILSWEIPRTQEPGRL